MRGQCTAQIMSKASPPPSSTSRSRLSILMRCAIGLVLMALGWTALVGHWLPGWLKPRIESEATAALGAPVRLGGLDISPWRLEVMASDLSIGPIDKPWLKLKQGEVGLSLQSLWRFAPVIKRVDLRAPELDVERLSADRFNFSPVLDHLRRSAPKPKAEGGPARFAVYNIRLSDGVVRYVDRVLDQSHVVDRIRLDVPFVSSLAAHVDVTVKPVLEAHVDGSALRVDAGTHPFQSGLRSEVAVRWQGVELAKWLEAARPLLPEPWRPVVRGGRLDADLKVIFDQRPDLPQPLLALQGRMGVRSLDISMPALAGVGALQAGWGNLEISGIDLQPLVRQVTLAKVDLDGVSVKLRPATTAVASAKPSTPIESVESVESTSAPAAPWAWSVGQVNFGLRDVDVQTLESPWPRLVKGSLKLQGLDGSERAQPAKWVLVLGDEHGGEISGQGRLQVARQAAELELQVKGWDLATWTQPLQQARLLPVQVSSGVLSLRTGVRVNAQPDAAGRAPSLQVEAAQVGIEDARILLGIRSVSGRDRQGTSLLHPLADQASWQSMSLEGLEADVSLSQGASALTRLKVAAVKLDAFDAAVSRDARGRVLAVQAPPSGVAASRSVAPAIEVGLVQCLACGVRFTDRSVQPAARFVLEQANFSARGVTHRLDAPWALDLRARAQGKGHIGFVGDVRAAPLSIKGQLSIASLDLRALQPYLDPHVNVTLAGASALAQGRIHLEAVRKPGFDESLQARYRGRLGLQNLRVRDRHSDDLLLRWASFTLERADLGWHDGDIDADLGFMVLQDFYGRVIVNRDGSLNLANMLRSSGQAEPASVITSQDAKVAASASVAAEGRTNPPRLRWQGISLKKGEVDFTDTFIQPNYSAHLKRLAGDISAVSSAQPEPAKVEVNALLDDGSPVRISGQLHPLGPTLFTDIKGLAKGIELTRLTPYAARYAGYPIEKGSLSVNVHYRVDGGKLQADNQIFLDQLTFGERVESPDATKLPVLLAVSLLKNARGEIDINLPISGSLDDPEFSVGGIIWRVVVNLLNKAVMAPFSLLAGDGGAELGGVPFPPGQADLDSTARVRLEQLAEKLKDRPALKIEATGWADADLDREGLRQAHVHQLMRKAKAKGRDADEVTIDPVEHSVWLKAAYQAADIKKPRNLIGRAQSLPDEQMFALLKASAVIDQAALKRLADERANQVKAYLSDRLDPERVRLTASRVGTEGKVDDKSGGSSVQFQLR